MDPTITLRTMRDATEDRQDRAEAAAELLQWISTGGFVPKGESIAALKSECLACIRENK